jgi:hypothetical protein
VWVNRPEDLVHSASLGLVFHPHARFFIGKLEAIDDWGRGLAEVYKKEMGGY